MIWIFLIDLLLQLITRRYLFLCAVDTQIVTAEDVDIVTIPVSIINFPTVIKEPISLTIFRLPLFLDEVVAAEDFTFGAWAKRNVIQVVHNEYTSPHTPPMWNSSPSSLSFSFCPCLSICYFVLLTIVFRSCNSAPGTVSPASNARFTATSSTMRNCCGMSALFVIATTLSTR